MTATQQKTQNKTVNQWRQLTSEIRSGLCPRLESRR